MTSRRPNWLVNLSRWPNRPPPPSLGHPRQDLPRVQDPNVQILFYKNTPTYTPCLTYRGTTLFSPLYYTLAISATALALRLLIGQWVYIKQDPSDQGQFLPAPSGTLRSPPSPDSHPQVCVYSLTGEQSS